MSKNSPVPRLDLAPKLKRPLSLWNPLDYLRLLYWVFFFPQALRWYVDTFGGGYILPPEINWRKGLDWLRQNPIQYKLLLQGLLLIGITPLALGKFLQEMDISINWWLTVVFFIAFSIVSFLASGIVSLVAFAFLIPSNDNVFARTSSTPSAVAFAIALAVTFTATIGMVGAGGIIFFFVLLSVLFPLVFRMGILRPEDWLIGSLLNLHSLQNGNWLLPRVTILPLPYLSSRLTKWLQQDWETGLHNANQLLRYTFQFIPVMKAVNQELAELPEEQLIFRITQLAEDPFDWDLVRFASADFFSQNKLRLDTPARAAAAGFWCLHEKLPTEAAEAFKVVCSLPYGEQIYTLTQTLAVFHEAEDPATISTTQIPVFPNKPLLRPTSWNVINSLRRVVEDAQVVQHSVSRSTRSFTLNRALGELTSLLNQPDTLPKAEGELIIDIAQTWQKTLLNIAGEVGEISITQPVTNPYIIGDPVEGNLFVGREDILRQLEELWVMSHQLQSIVIFGHRRMGKTSILRHIANHSGAQTRVIYINLQRLGDISQGVGEVLIAISDELATALQLPPPEDTAMLQLPHRTFERYLKTVIAQTHHNLIIALDEFEIIEDLIEAEKISAEFMAYLRGLVQMSPKVAFAFAGLHTLEEMTADYFQPFFASVIPIRVGFLTPGSTRQLLANPGEDFPLDYHPEALDQIYNLTAGQPYLVQLLGFQLVRRYNDQVFENGRTRDPVFSVEDVEAVINSEFFTRGRYYFTGVWLQAAQGVPHQQTIVKTLAPHTPGLSLEEIARQTNLDNSNIQPALETLRRHDVVEEKERRWRIIVELFRRWVLQEHNG